jgi:hypothetical protein
VSSKKPWATTWRSALAHTIAAGGATGDRRRERLGTEWLGERLGTDPPAHRVAEWCTLDMGTLG